MIFHHSILLGRQVLADQAARAEPVTGMVYLAISKDNQNPPIQDTDPEGVPLFSAYVQDLKPGASVSITRENRGHPVASLAGIPANREGVGALIELGVRGGRSVKPGLKVGICGEHGGEPHSIAFCHTLGLDYVSCSPFRVPLARLAAAQAALAESGSGAYVSAGG